MTNGDLPAEGWFPDPAEPGLLRYWDGAQWTAHTAPMPQAQPVMQDQGYAVHPQAAVVGGTDPVHAAPMHATQVVAAPAPKRPKGERIWNLQTLLVLLVCVALLIAAPIVLFSARSDAHREPAQQVLDSFVSAAAKSDDSWRKYASPRLSEKIEVGAPIGGEAATAEKLGLRVEYELGELTFEGPSERSGADEYDVASAPVTLTYTFQAYGEQHIGTAEQTVWLTRPFYYGSEEPQRSDRRKTPTGVGPWRVTNLTLPYAGPNGEDDRSRSFFTSDLSEEYDKEVDGNICYSPISALEDLSENIRIDGEVVTSCVPIDGESFTVAQSVDDASFAAGFPVIDSLKPQFAPRDLVMLDPGYSGQLPPIMQYHIKTSEGEYVVTYASTELEGKDDYSMSARLIYISEVGGSEE